MQSICRRLITLLSCVLILNATHASEDTFRVATYNVENYLDRDTGTRQTKPADAKAKVQEMLLSAAPDIVALQEVGSRSALEELQSSLKAQGLDLPYSEWVEGWDTNIHLAVLSRFPFVRRTPHTNESYLLSGRRLDVSRGFSELEIEVDDDYVLTIFNAHLKSKRPVGIADQAEMRTEEAKLLRGLVDDRLKTDPKANIVVCGDLNDTYNTSSVKALVGRGTTQLKDLRPAENNGDDQPHPRNPNWFPRNVAWTHHWGVEDSYSRIDYILISPAMVPEWDKADTHIVTGANWGLGSDHRPLVATFIASDR